MTSKGAQYTLIANVPYDTVRQDLVSEFRRFGRVELAMVVCDEASRHPHKEWTSTAGYAFVRFSRRTEAAAAIQAASMGLVTIRGVRVRADWARKDSYAKRGRVSPQQGAPLMGPLGVPAGIQALHTSLMSRGITQETTPVWVASQFTKSSWTGDGLGSSRRKASFPSESSSSEEDKYYSGLSDPPTSAGTDLSYSPVSVTGLPVSLPHLDSSRSHEPQHPFLPSEDRPQSACNPAADVFYARLADLLTRKSTEANACSSTTGSLTPRSPSPPSKTHDYPPCDALLEPPYPTPRISNVDSVLSPCSAGLLAQALKDVASRRQASPTAELTSLSSLSHANRPEELLHAAIKCYDSAGIQL